MGTLFLLKPEHRTMTDLAQNLSVPHLLQPLQRIGPTLSIGGRNASSPFHQHHENWFAQIQGSKAWVVSPNDLSPGALKEKGTLPCLEHFAKEASPGLKRCTLRVGEVLYLPSQWHHGTCNVAKFSLGFGYIGALDHLSDAHYAAAIGDPDRLRSLSLTQKTLRHRILMEESP